MKIKTSELVGKPLNWAVATCFGYSDLRRDSHQFAGALVMSDKDGKTFQLNDFSPSTGWSQGGPIIEQETISVVPCESMEEWAADAQFRQGVETQYGPTPLIAAMRCFVFSRLGDEVDVPDELLGGTNPDTN